MPGVFERHRRSILLLLVIGSSLATLLVVDTCARLAHRHAGRLTALAPLLHASQRIHRDFERNIVQFMPGCWQYDPDLLYRLAPGECTVENREHTVTYRINSAGLRDDEAALRAPQVIVLGDSFALGWGVEQDESFPALLRDALGVPLLNASMSSYGTARELILLSRLDRSALRVLVFAYCRNDRPENLQYVEGGYALTISPRAHMEAVAAEHLARTRRPRWPFYAARMTFGVANYYALRIERSFRRAEIVHEKQGEAELFLTVLRHALPLIDSVQILVVELNEYAENDPVFVRAVAAQLEQPDNAALAGRLEVVDLSSLLGPADYYPLDGHLNARGHARVAAALVPPLTRALGRGAPAAAAQRAAPVPGIH